ncbi:MAG: hypothetical protein C0490_06305 [Marivirga sp.]|nr:hypothetical protein [Marivirga sp.]
MAKPVLSVIQVLRQTASNLEKSSDYQWGHMGSCNCGFLAQQITNQHKHEIHAYAMQRHGDWSEQLNDYCPTSGLRMDELISEILDFGFDSDDLKNLEKLSDRKILMQFPFEERNLRHNVKTDVVKYLRTWANILETDLIGNVKLSLNESALTEDENEYSLSPHYSDLQI